MRRRQFVATLAAAAASLAAPAVAFAQSDSGTPDAPAEGSDVTSTAKQTGYAPVNGLRMYYEIHGEGRPTLLLHGAYGATGMWGDLLPGLAAGRQVVAVDLQGHGRTADVDRPIRYEALADDCAALLDHLGVAQADVVGYSMGAGTGLRLAIQHPARVRRQALASASFRSDGFYPEILEQIATISPEVFAGTPYEEGYKAVAPRPEDFPRLVEKVKNLVAQPFDLTADMPSIQAPTLLIFGDADVISPEHAVEMLRALGGGIVGQTVDGSPKAQLAFLPNTAHEGVPLRTELLLSMVPAFLDPEPSEATPAASG